MKKSRKILVYALTISDTDAEACVPALIQSLLILGPVPNDCLGLFPIQAAD